MVNLSETRKRFTIIAGVLGAISLLAVLYLVMPITSDTSERYKELEQTRSEFKNTEHQVLPLRGLPTKLVKSQTDIRRFYQERLPARYSAISTELGKLSAQTGAAISDVRYDTLETDLPDLELVSMNATVRGDYGKVVKFINGVERNKIFFLIDGLTLADQEAGVVRLELRLETYLRVGSEPGFGPADKTEHKRTAPRTGD